jgi:hypothetical protein
MKIQPLVLVLLALFMANSYEAKVQIIIPIGAVIPCTEDEFASAVVQDTGLIITRIGSSCLVQLDDEPEVEEPEEEPEEEPCDLISEETEGNSIVPPDDEGDDDDGDDDGEIGDSPLFKLRRVRRQKPVVSKLAALNMIKQMKLVGCVGRIICELGCNREAYGQLGNEGFSNLEKFKTFKYPGRESELKYYYGAEVHGKNFAPDCSRCYVSYPYCRRKSRDLLKLAATFQVL